MRAKTESKVRSLLGGIGTGLLQLDIPVEGEDGVFSLESVRERRSQR